jgi:tetratricopeptide (TPR) repeat protein
VSATAYWANDYSLFEHAYGIAPRNSTVRTGLAQELVRRGDYEKALPILEEQVKEQPNTFNANYVLGHTLYDLHQLPAAEHYLEAAKNINPAMPYTYFDLGLIDLRTGRTGEAEANMRQAVALRRYEPMVHFGLASALAVQGKCEEARAEFHQTLELQPDMPHVLEQIENCGKVSR